MDPTYPAFPILAFIAFILVLVPFPWHLQAWNSGTCLFMVWTAMTLLNYFINSVVWHNNAVDWAPIWCDISTRFTLAAGVGINAASLCISRRLYHIAACQSVSTSPSDKRRAILSDLAIGVGLPLIQLPLHYIVNGHRYDILEDVGCTVVTFNTPPAYPLTFIWPNVICLVSVCYGVLTLRAFLRRRAQFNQFLTSGSPLNVNRYFRLMALASIDIMLNIPISSYGLSLNLQPDRIRPWVSWADTHFDWFFVGQYPAALWRSNPNSIAAVELPRWATVAVAFVFFGFFGFADEAMKQYRALAVYLGIIKKKSDLKTLQLPLYNKSSQKPVASRPKRSDSTASSTVIASPSTKSHFHDSKVDRTIDTTSTNAASRGRTSMDSDEVAFAVYSPSSSPTPLWYPTPPPVYPPSSPVDHSVHTVPSLSAFPEPPPNRLAIITPPSAQLPKYSRHSSHF